MPRAFFLSPDPRTNHPFSATIVFEGTDSEGNPLAVVGDEYDISCLTPGIILFDAHVLKIETIYEARTHRAEITFISREGFTRSGSFTMRYRNTQNPLICGEEEVRVVDTVPAVVEPTITQPIEALPVETTPAVITPVPPITPTPIVNATPPITPTYVPPKSGHPLVWGITILVVCTLAIASQFNTTKPHVIPVSATRQTDASATTNKPDAAIEADTEEVSTASTTDISSVKTPDAQTSTPEPETSEPAPSEQPAPAAPFTRCGACP